MQNKTITKIINEICDYYSNMDKDVVLDILCSSLSEVLSSNYGYKVIAGLDDDDNLSINSYRLVNGILYESALSLTHIKKKHIANVKSIFQYKLDYHAANEFKLDNAFGALNVVQGRVLSFNEKVNAYTVEIVEKNVLGYCKVQDTPTKERANFIHRECYFYTKYIDFDMIDDKIRPIIHLSRTAKKFTSALFKHFCINKNIKITTHSRHVGKVSVVSCNIPIKKTIIKKVSDELGGERLTFIRYKGGAS